MSILYLIALAGVALALMAMLYEAVSSVGRKPHWMQPAPSGLATGGDKARMPSEAAPALQLVESADRRTMELPFVGRDRRLASQTAQAETPPRQAAGGT